MKPTRSLWLVLSSILVALLASANEQPSIHLEPTYQSPKHIVFSVFVPGSSHITWVMRFLDELVDRGHNVTFITIEQNAKYSAAYPRINTVSVDIPLADVSKIMMEFPSHPEFSKMIPMMITHVTKTWRPGYEKMIEFLENNKVDTVICDHRTDACVDAVYEKKIPMVLTATLAMFPDADTTYTNNNNILTLSDPTTQHQTLLTRFSSKFMLPLSFIGLRPVLKELAQIKQDAGVLHSHESTDHKSRYAIKIVCSLFGVEPARPIGPLVHLVGPLLEKTYAGLDSTFDSFLSARQRVAYVAFGQHAVPDAFDVTRVLGALIMQYEKGRIDGIIWSSKHIDRFPTTIQSSYSGKVYDLTLNEKTGLLKNLLVTRWSPQMAVLLHPSVSVFVSHGGANSLYESLYAGKRLIFYPFFGDQPGTAKQLSRSGVAEYFDHETDPDLVNERVEKVVLDVNGTYLHHVRRYQALIQIQAKSAPIRAADLVEESIFSSLGDGDEPYRLPHREDVGHAIHWFKRHNYDIYGMALLALGSIVSLIGFAFYKLTRVLYRAYSVARKTKTL